MTEPKFTPGPWHSDDYGYIWSGERSDAHLIAEVRGWGWIQYLPNPEQIQDANRDLIAAAPELYEALESFGLVWGECEECESSDGYAYLVPMDVMDEFREKQKAALAKARG